MGRECLPSSWAKYRSAACPLQETATATAGGLKGSGRKASVRRAGGMFLGGAGAQFL